MEKGIIERIRGGNATLKDYRHISTSQWITVCLGIGQPQSLPQLHRDLRDAWQRLDRRQRAIVLEAWQGSAAVVEGPSWSFQMETFPKTPGTADDQQTITKVGRAQVNGVDFHITAIPVEGEGREQKPLDSADCYEALQAFDGCDPGFETIDIAGTPHVVVFTPFAD